VKEPSGANYLTAVEIAGGQNGNLISFFEALLCAVAINGNPEPKARSKAMMLALADKLGRVGMDILNDWYQSKAFPEAAAIVEELGDDVTPELVQSRLTEVRRERLKNSLQTQ
jgi:hypothetical protein